MASPTSPFGEARRSDPPDFSLVLGGPLYQLLRRAHMTGDALELMRRRVVVISLFAWVPLLVLSALDGRAWGGGVAVPFLRDWDTHARFLVALPLLVVAELVVHQRMRLVVKQFLERNLIPPSAVSRFEAAIASAFRLRNSVLAEVLLIAFVGLVGVSLFWRQYVVLTTATWYATPTAAGMTLSRTGVWYAYVSLALFQFLLMRWYFRILIWARFLWHVSRIELSLIPTHPDRVGGLGFLGQHGLRLRPAGVGPRRVAGWADRQPHLLPRGPAARLQDRGRGRPGVHAVPGIRPPRGVRGAARSGEANGKPRVWHARGAVCPRVRCQVAARRSPRRRAPGGERRHPVPRRSGELASRSCGRCAWCR